MATLLWLQTGISGNVGFGAQVCRELAAQSWPDDVRLFEAGTRGIDTLPLPALPLLALPLLEDCTRVVIVDALKADGPPGGLKLLDDGELPPEPEAILHAAGSGELVRALRALKPKPPRIDILGTVAPGNHFVEEESPVAAASEDAAAFLIQQFGGKAFESGVPVGWRGLMPVEDMAEVGTAQGTRRTGIVRLPGSSFPTPILILSFADRLMAIKADCPHRGLPLVQGRVEGDGTIECPSHGWRLPLRDGPLGGWPVLERHGLLCLATGWPVEEDHA